jgi:hypothetical protein
VKVSRGSHGSSDTGDKPAIAGQLARADEWAPSPGMLNPNPPYTLTATEKKWYWETWALQQHVMTVKLPVSTRELMSVIQLSTA